MHIRKKSSTFAGNLSKTMQYSVVHLNYSFTEDWQQELLEQDLCDLGFEVFDGTSAYIQSAIWESNRAAIEELIANTDGVELLEVETCPDANWNAQWEAEHEIIELPLGVRITPHCAFGAGHHETTSMMIEALLEAKEMGVFTEPRTVLDMGCGTGVLGILACLRGAGSLVAIDIDEWSWRNAIENIEANDIEGAEVIHGDASQLAEFPNCFDIVLANINRNILLNDMEAYVGTMTDNAQLIMSGFYLEDLDMIRSKAESLGLHYLDHCTDNDWTAVRFTK